MNKKYRNHYPSQWGALDNEWKEIILGGFLSVSQASRLSGLSRQYIYKQVHSKVLLCIENNGSKKLEWKEFLYWYSHLTVLPISTFGPSSLSLTGIMNFTGMSRSWSLNFVDRNKVDTFFIGQLRRFDKVNVERAWKREHVYYKDWLNIQEITDYFEVTSHVLFMGIAHHLIQTKSHNGSILFRRRDIVRLISFIERREI